MSVFSEQVERLIDLGYPALVGSGPSDFARWLEPLAGHFVPADPDSVDGEAGAIPSVIVVAATAVPVARSLPLVARRGKRAIESLTPKTATDFTPLETVSLPVGHAYVCVGIERGDEYLDVTPDDALPAIEGRGRGPLTIEEGVALLTQYPEFLQPNRCFSLLASRCGDKRVPALWLSDGHPKLGWCWAGNPHSWLGSASCAGREGSVLFPSPVPAPAL